MSPDPVAEFARVLTDVGAEGIEMHHQRLMPRTLVRVNVPTMQAVDTVLAAGRRLGIAVTNVGGRQVTFVVTDAQERASVETAARQIEQARRELER